MGELLRKHGYKLRKSETRPKFIGSYKKCASTVLIDGTLNVAEYIEACNYDGYGNDACTKDKKGIVVGCPDNELKIRKCRPGSECGKCLVDVYDEGSCRCVDKTRPPNFPRYT